MLLTSKKKSRFFKQFADHAEPPDPNECQLCKNSQIYSLPLTCSMNCYADIDWGLGEAKFLCLFLCGAGTVF